ncbi:hypothetical protein EVAR_83402_1 [Eumeta japonica]|uniref:Uncharacterized protein n=1 Tax=Eumeta variegata TaxID=151549 RepID=A0A4C1TYF8_EUMVA|nr:hypothetical protein EVAR_83402_1 [Eumeta japonica]
MLFSHRRNEKEKVRKHIFRYSSISDSLNKQEVKDICAISFAGIGERRKLNTRLARPLAIRGYATEWIFFDARHATTYRGNMPVRIQTIKGKIKVAKCQLSEADARNAGTLWHCASHPKSSRAAPTMNLYNVILGFPPPRRCPRPPAEPLVCEPKILVKLQKHAGLIRTCSIGDNWYFKSAHELHNDIKKKIDMWKVRIQTSDSVLSQDKIKSRRQREDDRPATAQAFRRSEAVPPDRDRIIERHKHFPFYEAVIENVLAENNGFE